MRIRRSAERRGRLSSPTTWVALLAGGAVAGAIALAMAPANAEAASTTATLTFTGLVDSNCQFSTGGTTAYVAPGGSVTIKASLAGASVKVPATLPGLPPVTVPLDSAKVASFVDKVKIDGHKHTLKTAKDKIVLNNVNGTHQIAWKATAVSLLGGLGTVPLNGNDVNLPAGGQLSWSGKIVASKNTNCGVQIAVPTVKVSAPGHTLTVSGTNVSLPNPIPSITGKLPTLTPPNLPTGSSSSTPAHHPKTRSGGGGTIKYTPPPTTVPEKVMPHAVNFGGGGSGNGGFAPPAAGGGGVAAPVAPPVTSTAPAPPHTSPAAKIKPAKTVDVAQRDQLGGAQLPVLLAIVAILALSTVTAMYARMFLLRRSN